MIPLDLPLAALGSEVRLLASGVGDLAGPAAATVRLDGASVAPPAPVALRWDDDGAGGAIVRWTRRSRAGWRWADGGDVPLAEEAERYRIDTPAGSQTVTAPSFALSAALRAAGPVAVSVRQLGTLAESRPVTVVVPGN